MSICTLKKVALFLVVISCPVFGHEGHGDDEKKDDSDEARLLVIDKDDDDKDDDNGTNVTINIKP